MSNNVKVNFTADTSNFQKGVDTVSNSLKGLGSIVKAAMGPLLALAGAVSFGAGIKDVLDYGDSINDMANKSGVAASDITILQEALRQAGIEGVDTATILQKLSKNILNGMSKEGSKVSEWMKTFGLTMKEINGMNMAQQFEVISSRIGGLSNDTLKAAAASDFFGAKQGLLLVNLFKTENAMQDARETVGGLAGSMDKWASGFGYINDMLGAGPTKIRQFFAAFVGNNIEDFQKLADTIKAIDLTKFGAGAGGVVAGISNAIKDGKIFETLKSGFMFAVTYMGEILMGVMTKAGQMFTKSLQDSLEGSETGKLLTSMGLMNTKSKKEFGNADWNRWFNGGFLFDNKEVPNPDYKPAVVESLQDILKGTNDKVGTLGMLGSDKWLADWKKFTEPQAPISKFQKSDYRDGFLKAFSKEWATNIPLKLPPNFKEIYGPRPKESQLQKIAPEEGSILQPFKPVLSSLARIGGSAEAMTKDPLVSLQKTANRHLKKIERNTGKAMQLGWQ